MGAPHPIPKPFYASSPLPLFLPSYAAQMLLPPEPDPTTKSNFRYICLGMATRGGWAGDPIPIYVKLLLIFVSNPNETDSKILNPKWGRTG